MEQNKRKRTEEKGKEKTRTLAPATPPLVSNPISHDEAVAMDEFIANCHSIPETPPGMQGMELSDAEVICEEGPSSNKKVVEIDLTADDSHLPPKKRSGQFRLNTMSLFLTYPQCPLSPTEGLEMVQEKVPEILEYIVAQEKHQVRMPPKI
jgi:hypothetical protein